MNDLTANEMKVMLRIFKDFNSKCNANSLSKELGLSAMGVLKILKKLHNQNLLKVEVVGKARIYSINFRNDYAKEYLVFLLRKEAEESAGKVKRWVVELRKLEGSAEIGVLFGSVIKSDKFSDVDLLAVLKQTQLKGFNKIIEGINQLAVKKVHPVRQSVQDFRNNLLKKDKVLLSAVKEGIVLFGYEKFVEVVESVSL